MNIYERALNAFRSGTNEEAARLTDELIETSRASRDVPGEIDGLCLLGRVALRRGELRRVAQFAGEARELARRKGEPRLERMPLHLQAVAARMRGDFASARQLYRESIDLNRQLGEQRMVAAEHRNLAYVELHDRNAAEASELFSTSANLARAIGYDALEPYLLLDSAVLALEMGDAVTAGRLLQEVDAKFEAEGQIPDPDDAAETESLRRRLNGIAPDAG